MNSNNLVISTEGLSKSFGSVPALKALGLRVPQKSIFAFPGPNGAGKTTTIKLVPGLLNPTHGNGKILGMDILRDSVDIRARIGYLPQDARFYEHMTAGLLLVTLFHASSNTVGRFLPVKFAVAGGIVSNLEIMFVLIAAIVVIVFAGAERLSRTEEKQVQRLA